MNSIAIKAFCFNPFQENTYVLYNENKDSWIIDPGCFNVEEEAQLKNFILKEGLIPRKLLLTHAHIDHILGCEFVGREWGLAPELMRKDLEIYQSGQAIAAMYGLGYTPGTLPLKYIFEEQEMSLGRVSFTCIWVPGHSPGSICFYAPSENLLIAGDVLFEGSIGRTDLPGGNHQELLSNIRTKLFVLPNDTIVYPGHGGYTTIGQERLTNPFF